MIRNCLRILAHTGSEAQGGSASLSESQSEAGWRENFGLSALSQAPASVPLCLSALQPAGANGKDSDLPFITKSPAYTDHPRPWKAHRWEPACGSFSRGPPGRQPRLHHSCQESGWGSFWGPGARSSRRRPSVWNPPLVCEWADHGYSIRRPSKASSCLLCKFRLAAYSQFFRIIFLFWRVVYLLYLMMFRIF